MQIGKKRKKKIMSALPAALQVVLLACNNIYSFRTETMKKKKTKKAQEEENNTTSSRTR